jgi:hypothetical protein
MVLFSPRSTPAKRWKTLAEGVPRNVAPVRPRQMEISGTKGKPVNAQITICKPTKTTMLRSKPSRDQWGLDLSLWAEKAYCRRGGEDKHSSAMIREESDRFGAALQNLQWRDSREDGLDRAKWARSSTTAPLGAARWHEVRWKCSGRAAWEGTIPEGGGATGEREVGRG